MKVAMAAGGQWPPKGGAIVTTTTAAITALGSVKTAINQLASDRAAIGAYQARLNFTSEQLVVSKENLTAASSRIRSHVLSELPSSMSTSS